jgi:uncharacterized protein YeaO (DUF488 family)
MAGFMIRMKRVYEPPEKSDGIRILVDRLWPRGLNKSEAQLDEWMKEIAPSGELRKFYGHDISKWEEFREKYLKELSSKEELVNKIIERASEGRVTLLFAVKDEEHSNAAVLKEYLEKKM